MPTLIEARLRAQQPLRPDTRQLHGLACALFEGAEATDHDGQEKLFAVWPLRPMPGPPDQEWAFCATWLAAGPPPAGVVAPDQIRLGSASCLVPEITHRSVTHAALAAGPPLAVACLEFCSPTYFSQNGSDVVLPDPRLIAGSWRRRWNASLPDDDVMRIDDDAWHGLHRAIRLTSFDLRTRRMDSGRGHERAGFTGTATLRLDRDAHAAARQVLGTLVRFAEFCGTGAQTTHGFGATRVRSPSGE
ncbi:MAG TPA: CRISPR system precrRNA processing endoribonuclease RAMP protein Cas6 [Streptosporangiaceae bacterium]|nr:CRISPR system precrRNA processing endoribonuclease RAMP protein Cas6 [Streptosporangiaceae bacterium]